MANVVTDPRLVNALLSLASEYEAAADQIEQDAKLSGNR
jgi:hypothetical protein